MSGVARVAWYRFRKTLRAQAAGYVAIIVLTGLLGGVALAAVAGARRTQSSYPKFRASTNPSDLIVQPFGVGALDPKVVGMLSRLPHVTRTVHVRLPNAWLVDADGNLGAVPSSVSLLGSMNGMFFDQDRAIAVEGRLPNAERAGEMMLTDDAARALHVQVGDVVPFAFRRVVSRPGSLYPSSDAGEPASQLDIMVAGIVVLNSTLVRDHADRYPALGVFTPALMRYLEARCTPTCDFATLIAGFQVDEARSVVAVEHEIEAALPPQKYPLVELSSIVETKALRAVRPAAIALGVFGLIAALATLVIAGQVVARQLQFRAHELVTLRALGAGAATTATDGLIGIIGAIAAGAVLAVGLAVALSPLSPVGVVRSVYPTRGVAADWTVLAGGAATLFLGLSLVALVVAIAQAPHRLTRRSRRPAHRSAVAHAVAPHLPTPVGTGVRFALESGRGRNAVPVRSALFATVLAVVITVSTLVFGSSLRTLISHPRLYGWNWTYALQARNNGPIPPDARAALDRVPEVAAWSSVIQVPLVHIDDELVPAFAVPPSSRLTRRFSPGTRSTVPTRWCSARPR